MDVMSKVGESIEYWLALVDRLPDDQRRTALQIAEGLAVLALQVNATMQREGTRGQKGTPTPQTLLVPARPISCFAGQNAPGSEAFEAGQRATGLKRLKREQDGAEKSYQKGDDLL